MRVCMCVRACGCVCVSECTSQNTLWNKSYPIHYSFGGSRPGQNSPSGRRRQRLCSGRCCVSSVTSRATWRLLFSAFPSFRQALFIYNGGEAGGGGIRKLFQPDSKCDAFVKKKKENGVITVNSRVAPTHHNSTHGWIEYFWIWNVFASRESATCWFQMLHTFGILCACVSVKIYI